MADSGATEKAIKLTGGAVLDFQSLKKTGRRSRSGSRKNQKGGADVTPVISKSGDQAAPLPVPPPPVNPSVHSAANAKPVTSGVAPEQPGPTSLEQTGGAKAKPKLVLDPSKKHKQLIPSKGAKPKSTATRKNGKKIRVSLAGLGKRMTRHKSIQKEAKQVKIEDIKKALVEAKLVKVDTKAPESMLRQMYADYQTLKNKAL